MARFKFLFTNGSKPNVATEAAMWDQIHCTLKCRLAADESICCFKELSITESLGYNLLFSKNPGRPIFIRLSE